MTILTITLVEEAINRYKGSQQVDGGVLPADVRAMAPLYGLMIYQRARIIDLDAQPPITQVVVRHWARLESAHTATAKCANKCLIPNLTG